MIQIEGVNYLTVEEACSLLGVKQATIYAYVSRGVLRSYKQGIKRQRLYREDEVLGLTSVQPSGSNERAAVEPPRAPAAPAVEQQGEGLPPAEGWMSEM